MFLFHLLDIYSSFSDNFLMEQNQEKKFICKFCNKGYPCGKSLGGHIRTHMNNNGNSGEAKERAEISITKLLSSSTNARNMKRAAEVEVGGQSAATYALRENPKKSKRFSDPGNSSLLRDMICKECGKGFQSMKALCGHMACHSEKERAVFQKFEDHKLVVDSHSDTETSSTPSKRRRSKRMIRNKKANGGVYSNGSSSVSVIEEQEQEEVAMCLMMLSRDSKKGLNSIADSSENNSVILEAKSSSIDVRITIKNDMKCVKKQRDDTKLKSGESGPGPGPCSENSDSGYFRNGPNKVEPAVECEKLKVRPRSGTEYCDAKPGTIMSKFKCVKTEFPKDLVSEVAENEAGRGFTKLRRSGKNGHYSSMHDSGEDSLSNGSFHVPMTDTKATKLSNGKGLLSTVPCGNAEKILGSKKNNKGHECPFCFRSFKSGQALGGHKRSHFVGGSEDTTLVTKQDSPLPPLIDLNLPAPVEEDAW